MTHTNAARLRTADRGSGAVAAVRLVPAWTPRRRSARVAAAGALWLLLAANVAAIVWLWVQGGNLEQLEKPGDLLTSLGRLTGLLSAYAALVQVLLLARLPVLERLVGLDRLSVWHRWNGHVCLDLVLAHVVLTVWGYALLDRISVPKEIATMLGGGVYPGMITATVGTGLLIAVVVSSVVIVKRRLRYETWYLVHLAAYAGIALAWFHQIPTGNELVLDTVAADYWRALYVATLALLAGYRLGAPLVNALRFRLCVTAVTDEAPDVVSLTIGGRRLDRLHAQAGQFFLWRFLAPGLWSTAHPYSLSAAPDGRSLRITVKALGDHSRRLRQVEPGTRVLAEGPFGVFTETSRRRAKVVLIAGGIGVTPVRALLEEMGGDVVVLYRALSEQDVIFRSELERLARDRGLPVHVIVGDHATPEGRRLLSSQHLRRLVPDIAEREVYVCGPPAMTSVVRRNVRRAGVPARHIHTERFAL